MTSGQWYAVFTQPQRERLAAEQLEKQGFDVFFPRQIKTVRHARRLTQKLVSYFPNYIFVRMDLGAEPWRRVNGTIGVRSLVMAGDRPAAAPPTLIEGLRNCCDPGGVFVRQDWRSGERVRMVSGPFSDVVGVIDRLEGPARVRILMDMIGGLTPIVVPADHLALAS